MKKLSVFMLTALLLSIASSVAFSASGPPYAARRGLVVADDREAAGIGRDILKKGGNAVDAAVATVFALSAMKPQTAGLGGGGFALVFDKKTSKVLALDFRETAPAASAAFSNLSVSGGGELVATPGTPAGLAELAKKFGKTSLSKLVGPAAKIASAGFVADADFNAAITVRLGAIINRPETARIFTSGGGPPQPGDRIRQPDLARTIEKIGSTGASDFYSGTIAHKIIDAVKKAGGSLSLSDLKNYRPIWREPLKINYRSDYEIYSTPPPGGGTALLEILGIIEGYSLSGFGYNSSLFCHTLIEASKLGFVDFGTYIGDDAKARKAAEELTGRGYAGSRKIEINDAKAVPIKKVKPGPVGDFPKADTPSRPTEPRASTTVVAADGDGNMVVITVSLGSNFGSAVMPAGVGVLLNDSNSHFADSGPNARAPGKRPAGYSAPTIVLRSGAPMIGIGGGDDELGLSAVVSSLVGIIDFGMDVAQGLDAPRVSVDIKGEAALERFGAPKDITDILEAYGHPISKKASFGSVSAIIFDNWTRTYSGAADPRNAGSGAAGYRLAETGIMRAAISLILIAIALSASVAFAATPTARAVVKTNNINFGEVPEGDSVDIEFTIGNEGTGPLIIASTQPSCGCTIASPGNNNLAPGESTKITVRFDSRGWAGEVEKHVVVTTNDPTNGKINLTFSGTVKIRTEFDPQVIYLPEVKAEKGAVATITFSDHSGEGIVIEKIKTDDPRIETKFARTSEKGKPYRALITVRILPGSEKGRLDTYMHVFTTDRKKKEESIFIVGNIR